MKKQITMIMTLISMLFICTAVSGNDSVRTSIRTVQAPFHKIIIRDDVNVLLLEDPSGQISMEGNSKWIASLNFEEKDGVLDISCTKKGKKRITVFIPVQQLKEVVVKGRSRVASIGVLNSARIHVQIEGDCLVNIVTWGAITVDHDQDHDFEYVLKQRIDIPGKTLQVAVR